MKMNVVPITFSFDNNLVFPACICLSSLLMNAKADTFYDIFILHSPHVDLQKDELNKLTEYYPNCKIQYRKVDDCFDKSFEIRGITSPTYYRLLIPEVVPEYDKILYSDVDVIFRSDLSDIYFNTDLEGYYVAGVNSLSHLIPDHKKYYESHNVDPYKTIYAGNIILNSKALLEDNIINKFREHSAKQYQFQDMDVLNIVCAGKIRYLSPSFCVTTYFSEKNIRNRKDLLELWSEEELDEALFKGIVHYNGQKPWKGACINFDVWWEYYRKCPYFDKTYYFNFFNGQLNMLDELPLIKRFKILARYFVFGKKYI